MLKKNKAIALAAALAAAITLMLSGCSFMQAVISEVKGDLIGDDFVITEYDAFGNTNFRIAGDKVNLKGKTDSDGDLTSYIDITIDGHLWQHVGSTLVFAQNGIDMITDFEIPDKTLSLNQTSSGLMPVDRFVNNYKNLFGKEKVVLISTQNGIPIGLFQGDECYVNMPENLPKTTMAYIDGKRIYVHRADINILPVELFEQNLG